MPSEPAENTFEWAEKRLTALEAGLQNNPSFYQELGNALALIGALVYALLGVCFWGSVLILGIYLVQWFGGGAALWLVALIALLLGTPALFWAFRFTRLALRKFFNRRKTVRLFRRLADMDALTAYLNATPNRRLLPILLRLYPPVMAWNVKTASVRGFQAALKSNLITSLPTVRPGEAELLGGNGEETLCHAILTLVSESRKTIDFALVRAALDAAEAAGSGSRLLAALYFAAHSANAAYANLRERTEQAFRAVLMRQNFGGLRSVRMLFGYPFGDVMGSDEFETVHRLYALLYHLPRIQELTQARLTEEDWRALYAVLRKGVRPTTAEERCAVNRPPKLLLAIIEVAVRLEDTRALPAIRHLAQHEMAEAVRQAAQNALLILEAKAHRERQGETLLRASEAPPSDPKTLLRSASVAPDAEPEQLLRPLQE